MCSVSWSWFVRRREMCSLRPWPPRKFFSACFCKHLFWWFIVAALVELLLVGGAAPTSLGEGIGFLSGSNPAMISIKARLLTCVRAAPSSRSQEHRHLFATPVHPVLEAGGPFRLMPFLGNA